MPPALLIKRHVPDVDSHPGDRPGPPEPTIRSVSAWSPHTCAPEASHVGCDTRTGDDDRTIVRRNYRRRSRALVTYLSGWLTRDVIGPRLVNVCVSSYFTWVRRKIFAD